MDNNNHTCEFFDLASGEPCAHAGVVKVTIDMSPHRRACVAHIVEFVGSIAVGDWSTLHIQYLDERGDPDYCHGGDEFNHADRCSCRR